MPVRLYAVLRLRPRKRGLLPAGVKGERLTILSCAGCSVAVADTLGPLEPAVDNLLEFDRVIRALEDLSDAILPARFGAVSQSRAALKSEIAGSAGALAEALDNVAGRVQMNVRIPLDPEGPGKSLRRGTGSAYLQARAARSCPSALKTLRQAVADLVRDERIEPGPGGAVVYHLIDRADAGAYLAGVGDLRAAGPFPPYAFGLGIDRAVWPGHDNERRKPAEVRSARPRTHRRSARNAGR